MRRINDVRLTLIATQELGRWRMRSQLDAEESGSLSLGFAVGRSPCESASVCLTDAWSILPQICFGPIDRSILAYGASVCRASDTPKQSFVDEISVLSTTVSWQGRLNPRNSRRGALL
jgi:hypothetical protein